MVHGFPLGVQKNSVAGCVFEGPEFPAKPEFPLSAWHLSLCIAKCRSLPLGEISCFLLAVAFVLAGPSTTVQSLSNLYRLFPIVRCQFDTDSFDAVFGTHPLSALDSTWNSITARSIATRFLLHALSPLRKTHI